MRELGDVTNLTVPQVEKMIRDACQIMYGKPKTIIDGGVERPFPEDKREIMVEAFLEGSVARLAQWWRQEEREKVADVVNALDEDRLRVLATVAISKLGDLGYAIAEHPDAPEGVDPDLN